MKKLSVFIVMSFFVALFIMAQPPQGFNKEKMDKKEFSPEQKASKMSEKMKTDLGLSDEQTKQIYDKILAKGKERAAIKAKYQPILDSKEAEIKAVHEKYKTQLEPMHQELEASRKNNKEDFKSILTEEQIKQWQSIKPQFGKKEGMKKGCIPPKTPSETK